MPGLIVLVSFISPFRSERRMARELFAPGEFLEVFIDTPLAEAERRDVKGLYKKARRGELKNFTGIDSPYEPPESSRRSASIPRPWMPIRPPSTSSRTWRAVKVTAPP